MLFGEKGDHFGRAITLLAQTTACRICRGWGTDVFGKTISAGAPEEQIRKSADNFCPWFGRRSSTRKHVAEASVNAELLIVSARRARMELIGQRMLDGLEVLKLYQQAQRSELAKAKALCRRLSPLVRRNRDTHYQLGQDFASTLAGRLQALCT